MESGPKYAITKYGIIKLVVIAFACATFALMADVQYHRYGGRASWVFAAFVISFVVSVVFYIIKVTGLSSRCQSCGPCSLDGFDFLWSWFSAMWCLAASLWFVVHFPNAGGTLKHKLIAIALLAFATAILYAVEAYILKDKAPANMGYLATKKGWWKTIVIAFGAAAFGLMHDSGYYWCLGSCYSAITYALVAYIVAWAVTVIIWLGHIFGFWGGDHGSTLGKIEFIWSVICVLLFWSASACVAAYMRCSNRYSSYGFCQRRLAGVVIGFVTGVLYIVDAVFLRGHMR